MSRATKRRLRGTKQIIEEVTATVHRGLLQCLKEICSEKLLVPEDSRTVVVLHTFDRISIHGPRLKKSLEKIRTQIQEAVEKVVGLYYYWYVETTVEHVGFETWFIFNVIPKHTVIHFTRTSGGEVKETHSDCLPADSDRVVHPLLSSGRDQ